MGTLFVDENGERRGFRASRGKLTVGSAPEAKLRLVSEDVAALHADLEFQGGDLFVTPRSGVLPPRVQGVEVRSRTRVADLNPPTEVVVTVTMAVITLTVKMIAKTSKI